MQKIWKDAVRMLENKDSSLPGAPSRCDTEQKIKDSLKTKMNAIGSINGVPVDQRIVECFKDLFKKQCEEMVLTTLKSAYQAFVDV